VNLLSAGIPSSFIFQASRLSLFFSRRSVVDFLSFYAVDSIFGFVRNNINLIFRAFRAIPPSPRRPSFSPITNASPISSLLLRFFNISFGRIKIDRADPLRYFNNLVDPFIFFDDEELEIDNNSKLLKINEIIE
jgi:hypothetical protein